jgi:capsid portal protein
MEPLVFPERIGRALNVQMVILHVRAAWEELFKGHFGNDIIDEFFDLLEKKMVVLHLVTILQQAVD